MVEKDRDVIITICESRYLKMFKKMIHEGYSQFCILPYRKNEEGGFTLLCVGSLVNIVNFKFFTKDNSLDLHICPLQPVKVLHRTLLAEGYWESEELVLLD